jgi:molybdopterin synthase catalytic subunit
MATRSRSSPRSRAAEVRRVSVQADDFDPGAEIAALQAGSPQAGALASFIGVVRSDAAHPILALTLEHYPAMTTAAVHHIADEAERRFALLGCTIVHRFGRLLPGERIVFVGTASSHRRAALEATEFLIDWLKTRAPFWKQEHLADGSARWVVALAQDETDAERWLSDRSASARLV